MKLFFIVAIFFAQPQVARALNLQELGRVSNALLVGMDLALANKKFCGQKVTNEKISAYSQKLKEKTDAYLLEKKFKVEVIKKLMQTCEKDCSCDTVQYALEQEAPTATDLPAAPQLTAKQRLHCFKKAPQICTSPLFKSLSKP